MKCIFSQTIFVAAVLSSHALNEAAVQETNPIQKVLSMLSGLEEKILKEGQVAQKTYDEFSEWCEDRSKKVGWEIKDGKAAVASETATIESSTAEINSLQTKLEELADGISNNEADLQAATKIRTSEAADFKATEKDLLETIDILERAVLILEKEMKKGGAALTQIQKAGGNLVQAIGTLVDASMIASQDAAKLTSLVQDAQSDDDSDMGAPSTASYKGHSAGIIDTLEGLLDKAKGSLASARSKEQENSQNFLMLKQGLEDEIKYANKDLSDTKKSLGETQGAKATAQGDLSVASKDLNEDTATLKTLHLDCLEKAQDFEAETKSRGEELKALGAAKKVIAESTSGADSVTYGLEQLSFLQIDTLRSSIDLANFEAVRLVRDLARKTGDNALAQLASRMAAAIRRAKDGTEDPFEKVKELIKGMIEKLLAEAQADSTHKSYCDTQLGESKEKKIERTATIDKLSAKIDSMSAKSAQLREEVAKLQHNLAALASSQAETDKIRSEEKASYTAAKAEMEEGIEGIKMALKVLREYYAKGDKAHGAAEGAGDDIVGMLEVIESDFTKGLSEMSAAEQAAASDYAKESRENEVSKTMKEQSVRYKTKEYKSLDKTIAETKSDRNSVQSELDAINQFLHQLDASCIAKAESYGEKASRREAEIAGLKEALEILNGQAVFLQRKSSLRGVGKLEAA